MGNIPCVTEEQRTVEMLLGATYMPPPFNIYRRVVDLAVTYYDGDTHELLAPGEGSIRVRQALQR